MSAQQDIEAILEALVARGGAIHAGQVADILRDYRAMKQMYPEPGSAALFVDAMRMFIGHIGSAMAEQQPGSGNPRGNLMLQRMTWGLERMQAQLNGQPGNPATPVPDRAREGLLAQRPEAVVSGQRNPTTAERIADEIQTQYGCNRTEALLYVQQVGEDVARRAIDLVSRVSLITLEGMVHSTETREHFRRADPVQIHDDGSASFGFMEIEPSGVERGDRLRAFYPRLPLSVAIFTACGASEELLGEMCSPNVVTRTFTDANGRDWTVQNEAYHPSENAPIDYMPPVAVAAPVSAADLEALGFGFHRTAEVGVLAQSPQDDVIRRPSRQAVWAAQTRARCVPVAENAVEAQLNGNTVMVEHVRMVDGDEYRVVQAIDIPGSADRTMCRIAGPFYSEIEARAWMSKLFYERGTNGHRG